MRKGLNWPGDLIDYDYKQDGDTWIVEVFNCHDPGHEVYETASFVGSWKDACDKGEELCSKHADRIRRKLMEELGRVRTHGKG